MSDNPYALLGVGNDATADEVRRAYRRLARVMHPDVNRDDPRAEARFLEIAEAYRTLVDPELRRRHDRAFPTHGDRVSKAAAEPTGERTVWQEAGRREAEDGQDVLAVRAVDFDEAVTGGVFDVEVKGPIRCETCDGDGFDPTGRVIVCKSCNGSGSVTYTNRFGESTGMCLTCAGEGMRAAEPCETCRGSGRIAGYRVVAVEIPAGVDSGDTVIAQGQGGPGGRGGRAGDLYVVVEVRPHELFDRQGLDLVLTVPITYSEAVFGTTVSLPTLEGRVRIEIPPGTQGGTVLAVKGRGIAARDETGDLLVRVHVAVPRNPSEVERDLLDQLARHEPTDLRSHLD
jgi:molecular chaperone DnaJ